MLETENFGPCLVLKLKWGGGREGGPGFPSGYFPAASCNMAQIIAVATIYLGTTAKMDGKAIFFTMILPTNRWHFFTLCNIN